MKSHNGQKTNQEQFRLGVLGDESDVRIASQFLQKDGVIAMQMRGVCGLWVNAASHSAIFKACEIKGDTKARRFSTMQFAHQILPLVDKQEIAEPYLRYVEDPSLFSSTFGALCHVCLPLRIDALNTLPSDSIYSLKPRSGEGEDHIPVVYNLDPTGHRRMEETIRHFNKDGNMWLAVTTLNRHGSEEATNASDAIKLIHEFNAEHPSKNRIPIFLQDPSASAQYRGSFVQLSMLKQDPGFLRDGHVPMDIISKMLGIHVDGSRAQKHKFPQDNSKLIEVVERLVESKQSPQAIRAAILAEIQ